MTSSVINPWESLPNNAFVLPKDKLKLDAFNKKIHGKKYEQEARIVFDNYIPSPYIGNHKNALIVLLSLNPRHIQGYKPGLNHALYEQIARENLTHKFQDYHFYPLDPALAETPSGYCYFKSMLGPLIEATGMNPCEFSRKIFCVEYLPYFSYSGKYWNWKNELLPSQEYTVNLVLSAMKNEKIIFVILRSKEAWFKAIKDISGSEQKLSEFKERYYELSNPQCAIISRGNLKDKRFDEIVKTIKG